MVSMTNRSTEKNHYIWGQRVIGYVIVWISGEVTHLFFFFFEGGGAFLNMKAIFRLYISENWFSLLIYYVYIELNCTSRLICTHA